MRWRIMWAGIVLLLVGAAFGVWRLNWDDRLAAVIRQDDCTGLPSPYHERCSNFRTVLSDLGFTERVYNHPNLSDFPNLVDRWGWKYLGHGTIAGPHTLTIPDLGLEFKLREGERAMMGRDAEWLSTNFPYHCSQSLPFLVVYGRKGNELEDISRYAYIPLNDPAEKNVVSPVRLNWDEDLLALSVQLGATLEQRSAIGYGLQKNFEAMPRRVEVFYLEMPRSLSVETSIENILTYAYVVKLINQDEQVELSSAVRTILLPYRDGTLQFDSAIVRFDGEAAVPKSWENLWRDMTAWAGTPAAKPVRNPTMSPLKDYILQHSTCWSADYLPPRWAWPKDLPRYWEE